MLASLPSCVLASWPVDAPLILADAFWGNVLAFSCFHGDSALLLLIWVSSHTVHFEFGT